LKKALKIVATAVGILIAVLIAAFLLLGRDGPPPDAEDLVPVRHEIPAEENAYTYLMLATNITYEPHGWLDLWDMATNEHWEADVFAALVETNAAPLALLDRAVRCERLQVPAMVRFDVPVRHLSHMRNAARLMDLRAKWLFRTGREEEAFECALEIARYGRMLEGGGGAVIHYLVGMAVHGLGLGCVEDFARKTSLPSGELVRLAEEVAGHGADREGLANAFRAEYVLTSTIVDDLCEGRIGLVDLCADEGVVPLLPKSGYFFQPNRTRRLFADAYREMVRRSRMAWSEMDIEEFRECGQYRRSDLASLFAPNPVGRMLHDFLLASLAGVFERACWTDFSCAADRALLALRAYRQDHGGLPDSLGELVPDYLTEIPRDPFDGAPLRYSRNKGILYSVGSDLADDGGSTAGLDGERVTSRWAAEDIVFEIGFGERDER
jgi:hypothetical protein